MGAPTDDLARKQSKATCLIYVVRLCFLGPNGVTQGVLPHAVEVDGGMNPERDAHMHGDALRACRAPPRLNAQTLAHLQSSVFSRGAEENSQT